MADLDDFFAKKDKRKAKGKKFTTADEIAKKLEETGKKTKDTKKEKEKPSIPINTTGQESDEPVQQQQQEDDEWKEFEEEKKDYSGLKIQNLQLSDAEEEGEDDEEEEHENEAGEKVMRKKVPAGPWKMPQAEKADEGVEEIKDDEKADVEDQKDTQPSGAGDTGGSSYKPPHLRYAQQPLSAIRMRAKTKIAPDINNEEYFPTLSASKTVEPAGAWGKSRRENERGFEEVRNSKSHSSRGPGSGITSDMGRGNGSRLTLGNKYGALDQS